MFMVLDETAYIFDFRCSLLLVTCLFYVLFRLNKANLTAFFLVKKRNTK